MLHDFRETHKQALSDMPKIPLIGQIPIVGQLLQSVPIIGGFFGGRKPKIAYRDIMNMVRDQANQYGLQEAQMLRQQAEAAEVQQEVQQEYTGIAETRTSHLLTTPQTQRFGKQGELLISVAPATIKKGK